MRAIKFETPEVKIINPMFVTDAYVKKTTLCINLSTNAVDHIFTKTYDNVEDAMKALDYVNECIDSINE